MANKRIIVPVPKQEKQNKGNRTARTEKQKQALAKNAFPKGVSGNPSGRPKGSGSKNLSTAYEAILNQEVPAHIKEQFEIDGKCTWSDFISIQLVKKAAGMKAEVNFTALTELREVTEGKLPETNRLTGPNNTPLQAPTFSIPVEFVDPPDRTKENSNDEHSEEDS